MNPETFEDLVADALAALPEQFADMLDNVVVVVEDWPDRGTLRSVGVRSPTSCSVSITVYRRRDAPATMGW